MTLCDSGGVAMVVVCRIPVAKAMCMCLGSNTDHLRSQLDKLHAEAESTRAKANTVRLRLMRLSEAAENLKRQAAISVHSGKENDARELLFQKKKIMQAMENSKSRIELLDKLSAKLNEAISVKESQLIGNIAFDLEVDWEDDSSPVRIVSPKQGVTDKSDEDKDSGFDALKLTDSQWLQFCSHDDAKPPVDKEQGTLSAGISSEDGIIRGLKDISSYEDFLEHLDVQLNRIEAELATILNVSALVLNDNEKPKNLKVQQTIELLESILAVRQKIARIMQKKAEIS